MHLRDWLIHRIITNKNVTLENTHHASLGENNVLTQEHSVHANLEGSEVQPVYSCHTLNTWLMWNLNLNEYSSVLSYIKTTSTNNYFLTPTPAHIWIYWLEQG